MRLPATTLMLLPTLLLLTASLAAAPPVSVCRDAEGRAVFSDRGCPEDAEQVSRGPVGTAQTYDGKESIDTGVLNSYESRYGTGRSWQWQTAPASGQ